MRKIVLQMMTTLNGRLDDPLAWIGSVGDDQYQAIDRLYATYDTVLVGRVTYEEMASYWPGALSEDVGTETNRKMARRMNDYRKLVFTRSGSQKLTEWNNVERVVVADDEALAAYLLELKARPGGDIHLSGGASLAQTVIGLGLVDAFHFFVYPVASPGATWFGALPNRYDLRLMGAETYDNGVVGLHYEPLERENAERAGSFSKLLV
ncbi:dihydrofolate reductase family protein [Ensifer sp. LC163]|uniref:dihydrofolate reductase family protein n=1 Tax=Ensifer sp. LC163 TaxID=1120652 RepID=UPI000813680F|nr:dihydrofolate reductase family protein [Ensifer sp. LC163]OCP34532.1 riboflavin biosynthesis protein RibD [Ensifer sp. LC163]